MTAMKIVQSHAASAEVKCPAYDGMGFATVAQPAKPGRKIFPPPCKQCLGKGRVALA
jgi:hypothetical protein